MCGSQMGLQRLERARWTLLVLDFDFLRLKGSRAVMNRRILNAI